MQDSLFTTADSLTLESDSLMMSVDSLFTPVNTESLQTDTLYFTVDSLTLPIEPDSLIEGKGGGSQVKDALTP